MDTLSPAERSKRMSLVRSKDTGPEMVVRRLVHSLGFRYRLHDRKLPGGPDLVFRSRQRVIFIHGCFWHQHSCAGGDRIPKSRLNFWRTKLRGNVARDRRAVAKLRRAGWRVLVIWECQLREQERLTRRIVAFLGRE
jgi:DNA mismatch endonuclease, patch repair protein